MNKKNTTAIMVGVHIVAWGFMFLSPIMFVNRTDEFDWKEFIHGCMMPTMLCITFYVNYLYLVPQMLIKNRKKKVFFVSNACIVTAITIFLHEFMMATSAHKMFHGEAPPPPDIFFIVRDMFTLVLTIGISASIKLSMQWSESEKARQEAEVEIAESELKNLRSQINPHFLLNTLNNIYALIAFNSNKAQDAVLELSKMLRHILYEDQLPSVNLSEETAFICNYINLMKIRLQDNIQVKVDIHIPQPCTYQIAPLIFISLIENAFKHGISATLPSFINIKLDADDEKIICDIENSNFPKTRTDKSGHGIGLKQVEKRLEHSYPGKYMWTKGVSEDGKIYSSKIIIYDTKMCNR